MRRTVGLLTAAALVGATALGIQGGATGAPAPSQPAADGDKQLKRAAVAALRAHPGKAKIAQARRAEATGFRLSDTLVDDDGTSHVRLDRTYGGLPVVGGDVVVHQSADGDLLALSDTLAAAPALGTDPAIGAKRAERAAVRDARRDRDLERVRGDRVESRLVVDALAGSPRLAYEVLTAGRQVDGTPSRRATYVDARSGRVVRAAEQIHDVDGEGHSLYSGTVSIDVAQSGSSYTLTDPERGNGRTTDMQNRQDSILCTLLGLFCFDGDAFTSPDPSFGDGSNGNRESAAVDAHYGAATTYDYFQVEHGRSGIFGDGRGVISRVHYGNNYVNAFWDGEKMTYGDGDGVDFGPLVSLDVAGHEMTHGITENTANLTYSGEPGGINEATSDIFGSMVEFYAANGNDPGDYYIGEQFDLAEGVGFRRMDDPQLDGNSHSCWSGSTSGVDVHYSSGVGNHFFYLLAEGSGTRTIGGKQHDSPTCDRSTVTGIGRDPAAAIWFRALDAYMISGTNYAGARQATLSAAADLYGAGSVEHDTVAAAWSAVNVN